MKSRIKLILIVSVLLAAIVLAACSNSSAATTMPKNTPSTTPSVFKIEGLAINPDVVNAGVQALITAKVTNTGAKDDSYIGEIKIINPNKPSLPSYLYSDEVVIPSGRTTLLSAATTINYPGIYKVIWGATTLDLTVNPEEPQLYSGSQNPSSPVSSSYVPDFSAVDVVTGKKVTLSQFKGSAILLNFVNYGCSSSLNNIVSAQLQAIKQLKDQGVDFVPVSVFCGCCPPEVLQEFAKTNNFNWTWILDTDYSIAKKYQNYLKKYGYPTLVFINKDMKISETAGATDLAGLTVKLNKISPVTTQ